MERQSYGGQHAAISSAPSGSRRPAGRRSHERQGRRPAHDFGESEDTQELIEWDEFFRIFDENDLVFPASERSQICRQAEMMAPLRGRRPAAAPRQAVRLPH
ncbi:hypothetical protein LB553_02475 [Mesorhizobium sp. CA8]|uniref:hypothetical protein n=1 Tax=Mesorhizobium sp. CA8 TaxID=2876637 RepID=UPI001CCC9540|nr:hypothetical protein [Mesorhizobium sp. CA8]MBZ9759750.1 hypothetical protein [Mesorhizobium sp. CA8]